MNLSFVVEVTLGGLLAGVMYSLVALGFVLIYKASGVFNYAQGSMVLFAALSFVGLLLGSVSRVLRPVGSFLCSVRLLLRAIGLKLSPVRFALGTLGRLLCLPDGRRQFRPAWPVRRACRHGMSMDCESRNRSRDIRVLDWPAISRPRGSTASQRSTSASMDGCLWTRPTFARLCWKNRPEI